jgi:hypothetical protein
MRFVLSAKMALAALAIAGCGSTSATPTEIKAQANAAKLKVYRDTVTPKLNAFRAATTRVGNVGSGTGTDTEFVTALQGVLDTGKAAQQALKDHPAPDCLATASSDTAAGIDEVVAVTPSAIEAFQTGNSFIQSQNRPISFMTVTPSTDGISMCGSDAWESPP